jgi:hypothetical protein
MSMQRHFVEFLSPGTFVSETTEKPIDSWNVDVAVRMAADICERYNARPYGFRFITRGRKDDELDSRVLDRSGIYYLGGVVRTADEVLAGTDPDERILRSNVESNGFKRIIVNDNSWRFTTALRDDDVVLDVTLPPHKSESPHDLP